MLWPVLYRPKTGLEMVIPDVSFELMNICCLYDLPTTKSIITMTYRLKSCFTAYVCATKKFPYHDKVMPSATDSYAVVSQQDNSASLCQFREARMITHAYKNLQIEPHVSTQAAGCTVSMGSLTTAITHWNDLCPQQLPFTGRCPADLAGQPSSPNTMLPSVWSTLTHSRCMHIWLVDSDFPGILRARHCNTW